MESYVSLPWIPPPPTPTHQALPPAPSLPFLAACYLLIRAFWKIGQVQPPKEPLPLSLFLHTAFTNGCVALLSAEKAPIELCVSMDGMLVMVGVGLRHIQRAAGVKALFSCCCLVFFVHHPGLLFCWSHFYEPSHKPLSGSHVQNVTFDLDQATPLPAPYPTPWQRF